jgi:ABC-2 type transport system ATP-binding protein
MNPNFDAKLAEERIEHLGLDPRQKAGKLSGGQRAQLALTLAIAKRPELLVLDEPVASLDPLARREFLQGVIAVVADSGTSVILSSHLVADLERVCDYLVVVVDSHAQVAGEIDELLASHYRLTGPRHTATPCRATSSSSKRATPTVKARSSSGATSPSSIPAGRSSI